jgi:hypothetical protein
VIVVTDVLEVVGPYHECAASHTPTQKIMSVTVKSAQESLQRKSSLPCILYNQSQIMLPRELDPSLDITDSLRIHSQDRDVALLAWET